MIKWFCWIFKIGWVVTDERIILPFRYFTPQPYEVTYTNSKTGEIRFTYH